MEWCLQQEIPTEKIIWILRKAKASCQTLYPGDGRMADPAGDCRASDRASD